MEECWSDSDRGSPKYSEKMPVQLLSKIRVIIRHLCDVNPWLHCLAVAMERHQYAKRLIGTVTKFHPQSQQPSGDEFRCYDVKYHLSHFKPAKLL